MGLAYRTHWSSGRSIHLLTPSWCFRKPLGMSLERTTSDPHNTNIGWRISWSSEFEANILLWSSKEASICLARRLLVTVATRMCESIIFFLSLYYYYYYYFYSSTGVAHRGFMQHTMYSLIPWKGGTHSRLGSTNVAELFNKPCSPSSSSCDSFLVPGQHQGKFLRRHVLPVCAFRSWAFWPIKALTYLWDYIGAERKPRDDLWKGQCDSSLITKIPR